MSERSKTGRPRGQHERQQETDDDSGRQGGQSGQVEFRDFLGTTPTRDDLPTSEIKQLLDTFATGNAERVKKQKSKRDDYQALRDGKVALKDYRQGLSNAGMSSQYKSHPTLSQQAQFSGIDPQVNPEPNLQHGETNEADRNELENQYRLTHQLDNTPHFTPKPTIYNR